MCGIAGVMDLTGTRTVPDGVLERMSRAIVHRGPDEEGFFRRASVSLASRRLSIVGLADGQQPMANERGDVSVVFNGELFDHVEKRVRLIDEGHHLHTHCDTEILPHMWEDHAEGMFERLRGQFAVALWDEKRRLLTLGRDRFGIAPLYWSRQGDWLLFASEIKGIIASGMIEVEPDLRGIDHIFSFSAMPGPITCFKGIQMLSPGSFIQIPLGQGIADTAPLQEKAYFKMDFPDAGDERDADQKVLVDEFEHLMLEAVRKRLRADVPVGSYLSGGVDSSMIVALSCKVLGEQKHNINTYTIQVDNPEMDELSAASSVAKYVGTKPPIVQTFRHADAIETYPKLIRAAECPVIDTACAALLQLSHRVQQNGQKVVLTGEGADEWLVGYPWYKIHKILNYLDVVPGLRLSNVVKRGYLRAMKVPQYPPEFRADQEATMGGTNAWIDSYGMLSVAKLRFYSDAMHEVRTSNRPWSTLGFDLERGKKWHPLNRSIWAGARILLAGHLLQAKGDRVAMHNSVEVRYPFLDEDVFNFTALLHPKWKLKGLRDKHLLRLLAERYLPKDIYSRGKVIFRAPLDSFHLKPEPVYVGQLLSEESMKKTGYFDHKAVQHWREAYTTFKSESLPRLSLETGLAAIVATQLWHHLHIKGDLCELPSDAGTVQRVAV